MKHHGNLTEKEKDFIGSLSALMIRHNVLLETQPFSPSMFASKNDRGESISLSIQDIERLIIFPKEA